MALIHALATTTLLLGLAALARSHSYHAGSCPNVRPMRDFDVEKFMGSWYVLQKSKTRVRCLVNEYLLADIDEGHNIDLVQRMKVPVPGVNNGVNYYGRLSVGNSAMPSIMRAQFPLNVLGSSSYEVLDTDYSSYAVVFSCQKVAFWNRQSATIMSRTPSLAASQLAQLRGVLRAQGIDPADLNTVPQNCEGQGNKGIQINVQHEVFDKDTQNILKDTGSVVAGAAEVAKTASDVYSTFNTVFSRRRRDAENQEEDKRKEDEEDQVVEELLYWMP